MNMSFCKLVAYCFYVHFLLLLVRHLLLEAMHLLLVASFAFCIMGLWESFQKSALKQFEAPFKPEWVGYCAGTFVVFVVGAL